MHSLESVIAETRSSMKFHRNMARYNLGGLGFVASLLALLGVLYSQILIGIVQAVGRFAREAVDRGGAPVSPETLSGVSNQHDLGYIMVSGFILLLVFVAGLLRYHVKRSTIAEDRLYHLLRVDALRNDNGVLEGIAQSSLLDLRESELALQGDFEAHGGLAVIESILKAVNESVSAIGKRARK
ncbi:MAG: hypothetical protein WBE39_01870 [Candidatus Competibacter sp.]